MAQHHLDNWKQYLTDEDYNYLIQYIENIKNNIANDKMIILSGPGRSGKSTLIHNISTYLGNETCGYFPMPSEIIYLENIKKLGIISEIDEKYCNKKSNIAIINLIKYNQSLMSATTDIEEVNKNLLKYSKIIKMNHIF
jgi:ABC-type phosphate/phosphonate transport system ATPase subunit